MPAWRGVTLVWKVGGTKLEVPRIKMPKASREVGNGRIDNPSPAHKGIWVSVISSPSGVQGVLELSKHVWTHIANFGHSWTLSDASSFSTCNRLNSVYWAFRIWVNYIKLRPLQFVLCNYALLVLKSKFLSCTTRSRSSAVARSVTTSSKSLIHRVSKKVAHCNLVHIFAKYWPIFIILSPTHSVGNLQ